MNEEEISKLSDEELVEEFEWECRGADRWITGDPPMMDEELKTEILRRLKSAKTGGGQ